MKRIIFVLSLLAGSIAIGWSTMSVDTTVQMDNELTITTNTNLANVNTLNNSRYGGAFYLYKADVMISGDLAPDMFSNAIKGYLLIAGANVANDGTAKGLFKNAYVDWIIDPAFVYSFGIIKNYFGTYQFGSGLPGALKDVNDQAYNTFNTAINSADFGMMISGKLLPIEGFTKNLLCYNLEVENGEGYKTVFSGTSIAADNYAYLANIGVQPVDGLTFGFSYRGENQSWTTSNTTTTFAVYATAKDVLGLPIDAFVDYTWQSWTNVYTSKVIADQANVLSVSAGYGFFDKKFTPYVRYDVSTPTTNTAASNQTSVFYVGANIKPSPQLAIKPLFGYYFQNGVYTANKVNYPIYNDILIRLELEYKMNFKI